MPCVLLEERKISAVHLYKLRPSASLNGVERNSLTHIASPQCCTVYTHTQNRCKQHFLMDPHFFSITKSLHLLQSQSAEQLKHPYAAHCCFLPQINLPGAANKPETMEQRCITFFPRCHSQILLWRAASFCSICLSTVQAELSLGQ